MPGSCWRLSSVISGSTRKSWMIPRSKTDDKLPAYREGFARLEAEKKAYQLLLQRVPSSEYGSLWKVSNATVAKLPKLYQALGYGPVVEWFIEHIPEGRLFTLNLWEWAMMLAYLALAFLFVVPVTWLLQWPLSRSSHPLKLNWAPLFVALCDSLPLWHSIEPCLPTVP